MKTLEERIDELIEPYPVGSPWGSWHTHAATLLREAAEELRKLRGALEEADSFAGRCICGEERRVHLRQRVRAALRSKP